MLKNGKAVVAFAMTMLFASTALAEKKLNVLIIDGRNNHNWKDTTPVLKSYLEETGKFDVKVSTTPPNGAPNEAWDKWNPSFEGVDVVLSNYNGQAWPKAVQEKFEAYMKAGGGLVNVHAANNAHNGWAEFEKMTGLLWRNNKHGWRLALNKDQKEVRVPVGEGPGAGHGPQHSYQVLTIDTVHPITVGMPMRWQHTKDELYHGQRGPAKDMKILAVAYSDKSKRGTEMFEPMLWWIPYGKGRAVTTVLGHVGRNDSTDMPAMRCVGFKTIVQRACEWAATGATSIPVPENFPTADKTSTVELDSK